MNLRTLTLNEAHERTGIPVSALRKLFKSGKVTGNRVGNRVRLSEDSLDAFVHNTPAVPLPASGRAFPEVEDRFA